MPNVAAVLVSVGSKVYNNLDLFSTILIEAEKANDVVHLIIGGSLRRWNLMNAIPDEKTATVKSIMDGREWRRKFLGVAIAHLGDKFGRCLEWEELRMGEEFQYKQFRKEFDNLCSKAKALEILSNIFSELQIITLADFIKNEKALIVRKGTLINRKAMTTDSFKQIAWENALAATMLEYALRHFKPLYSESHQDAEQGKEEDFEKTGFKEFLFERFFPNSFEHQAEETTMLYLSLPNSVYKTNNYYYSNAISPIFRKAYAEWIKDQSPELCHWKAVKIEEGRVQLVEGMKEYVKNNAYMMDRYEKAAYSLQIGRLAQMVASTSERKRDAIVLFIMNVFSGLQASMSRNKREQAFSTPLFLPLFSSSVDNFTLDAPYSPRESPASSSKAEMAIEEQNSKRPMSLANSFCPLCPEEASPSEVPVPCSERASDSRNLRELILRAHVQNKVKQETKVEPCSETVSSPAADMISSYVGSHT